MFNYWILVMSLLTFTLDLSFGSQRSFTLDLNYRLYIISVM